MAMASEIKQKYDELRKKYNLPDYKAMDMDFDISHIDDGEFLLRDVNGKIAERVEAFVNVLMELLQPDTASLAGLHECRFFNDEEKREIYEVYKKLMMLHRASLEISVYNDEKKLAGFVKDTYGAWPSMKERMLAIIRKMKESWKKESSDKGELGYLG